MDSLKSSEIPIFFVGLSYFFLLFNVLNIFSIENLYKYQKKQKQKGGNPLKMCSSLFNNFSLKSTYQVYEPHKILIIHELLYVQYPRFSNIKLKIMKILTDMHLIFQFLVFTPILMKFNFFSFSMFEVTLKCYLLKVILMPKIKKNILQLIDYQPFRTWKVILIIFFYNIGRKSQTPLNVDVMVLQVLSYGCQRVSIQVIWTQLTLFVHFTLDFTCSFHYNICIQSILM
ncbi:hypothetical protein pb186bvf_003106 [Paramecium bursaria]